MTAAKGRKAPAANREPYGKDSTTLDVTLPCYEGVPGGEDALYAPPGKVVRVCVVTGRVFLDLCDYEETHDTYSCKVTGTAQLDAEALLNALVSQMDVERVRHIVTAWPVQPVTP